MRLSGTDFIEGGIDPVEAAAIAQLIEPLVDFLDVSMSSYWRFHKFLSTLDDPLGYEIETSEQVTQAVAVPTIVTGRIMTLDHASHLVETGVADMVSMVRAMIADPHLVAKARDRARAEIRPVHRHEHGLRRPADDHRPAAVRRQRGRRQGDDRAVRDAGPGPGRRRRCSSSEAGPAGLEAARTAALRGHDVAPLRDDGPPRRPGPDRRVGAPSLRPRGDHPLAGRRDRRGSASTSTSAPRSIPTSSSTPQPDEVIVATGSTPRRDGFQLSSPPCRCPAADLPHVFTVWDVLGFGGRATIGATAVVYDDTGTFEAISAADVLVAAGAAGDHRQPPRAGRREHALPAGHGRGQP